MFQQEQSIFIGLGGKTFGAMFGEKDKIKKNKTLAHLVQPDGTITAALKHRPSAIQCASCLF